MATGWAGGDKSFRYRDADIRMAVCSLPGTVLLLCRFAMCTRVVEGSQISQGGPRDVTKTSRGCAPKCHTFTLRFVGGALRRVPAFSGVLFWGIPQLCTPSLLLKPLGGAFTNPVEFISSFLVQETSQYGYCNKENSYKAWFSVLPR